jgi:hypothetical protein
VKCPFNDFNECKKQECPFFNIRVGQCLIPRALLASIRIENNTKELLLNIMKEKESYDGAGCNK